ncbi:radical SAM protein [Streptomyces sp. NPDC001292]|uniref:radical SAM protein n=1 Tax=Streptomyces sp. NPDC001292 TaxID=3364558 RepID=UPI0036766861
MKLNPGKTLMKFDRQLPLYNWLHPLKGQDLEISGFRESFGQVHPSPIRMRALYFHIPFCETICTFCTLNRGLGSEGEEAVEKYTQALIAEIRLKSRLDAVTAVPPTAIWFGGGTPSVLSTDQIRRIGAAIHESFDLSRLEEFTVEMEVKSVTEDKCQAFREIGANKARFGLQTFHPRYRELFNITAELDQTYAAAELFGRYFPHRSFDILYGMHGQTFDDLSADLQQAVEMGTETIEFYPINHLATQNALHTNYQRAGLRALSYADKMGMSIYINSYLRAAGFRLHNGHGYVRPEDPQVDEYWISRRYSNKYHECYMGYHDDDLIGFGSSGISQSSDLTVMNDESRTGYVRGLLDSSDIKVKVTRADHVPYERGIVLRLPFHGEIRKDRIPWDRIDAETTAKLSRLCTEGLIEEHGDEFVITELGWIWYVNMMYYLSPTADQKILDDFIALRSRNPVLVDGNTVMPSVKSSHPAA